MAKYLLIESQDPYEGSGVRNHFYPLAVGLAGTGHRVTLFLVENGVLPARRGEAPDPLQELINGGVSILADEFALRERGIVLARIVKGVKPAPLQAVIDQLAEGRIALWH